MPPVYLVCPANFVTGGTELVHQLGRCLIDGGASASLVYYPFDQAAEVPGPFKRYAIPVVRQSEVPDGAIVVVPEIAPWLGKAFPRCQRYLWWMSVDNFFGPLSWGWRKYLPRALVRALAISRTRKAYGLHLYQSEYARRFLADNRLQPAAALSDYLASEYLDAIANPPTVPREDIVVFNPKKGAAQTAAIAAEIARRGIDGLQLVPLENMSRDEVKDLLSRAKLYIDFGNHPGKDRIPREAAALGACLLANHRGSAGNPVDIAVDDFYKVDDTVPDFAATAVDRILDIIADYPKHSRAFDGYRARIAAEPDVFRQEALALFTAAD